MFKIKKEDYGTLYDLLIKKFSKFQLYHIDIRIDINNFINP